MTGKHPQYKHNRKTRKRMRRHIRRGVQGWEIILGTYTADVIQSITPQEAKHDSPAHK